MAPEKKLQRPAIPFGERVEYRGLGTDLALTVANGVANGVAAAGTVLGVQKLVSGGSPDTAPPPPPAEPAAPAQPAAPPPEK